MGRDLEALGDQDDGVSSERHFQDGGRIRFQQQVNAIQRQLQGRTSSQEHHRGELFIGRLNWGFQAWLCQGAWGARAPGGGGDWQSWCLVAAVLGLPGLMHSMWTVLRYCGGEVG